MAYIMMLYNDVIASYKNVANEQNLHCWFQSYMARYIILPWQSSHNWSDRTIKPFVWQQAGKTKMLDDIQ